MGYRIVQCLFLLLALCCSTLVHAQDSSTYRLSSGDVISINVHGEEDLSFEEVRLNDAGSFSFPFLGEIRAQGLTASQLEDALTQRLMGDYLINPRVSISILTYREFFISGEVRNPGGYPYQPGLTLRRAIALAGGMTERASTNRITIIRDRDGSNERGSLDSIVMPGDTITIDQGFF